MDSTRKEIIDWLVSDGLVDRCISYQTHGANPYLRDELMQELWVWLLTYDIDKLYNAYSNRHMNALISRWISNQYHSVNSPFHKQYRKYQALEDEIDSKAEHIPDEYIKTYD